MGGTLVDTGAVDGNEFVSGGHDVSSKCVGCVPLDVPYLLVR